MNEEVEKEVVDQVVDSAPEEAIEKPEPLSLREALVKARDEVKEEPAPKKEFKARAEDGKFVKQDKEPVVKDVAPVVQPVIEEIKVPDRYPSAVKEKWKDLPIDVKQALAKSAEDFHRELTRHDEERVLARQFKETVSPYIAQIRAEGSDPIKATQALYDTAYRLRNGTPQQKGQLLWETARAFGADMSQGLQQQQAQPPVHPMLQQTLQEVHNLKAQLQQQEALKKQQEDMSIQSQIDAFKNDPKNVHFESVKAHMASLLQSGLAKDLQDAYDQAVYANPQTRASLLTQQQPVAQEKRVADMAKAAAAKKAGSSIKGSPGIAATRDARIVQPDLRSELRAAFAAQGNA